MSKDQKITTKKIVENVDICESLLLSYKTLLENNDVINTDTKKTNKMSEIFPWNVEYQVLCFLLKESDLK